MKKLDIDFLVSSANKCIQGVPGFGFVIAKKEKLMACDLSNKDSFKESIQKYLNEIFKDDMAATQEKTQKPVRKTQDTSKAKYVPRKQRNIEKQTS